jgi:hypothetical protein
MTERPFRHLCPEADKRDAMTDEEFWAHVYDFAHVPDCDFPDFDEPVSLDAAQCVTCGETGACAFDSEGRALIHATGVDDE